MDSDDVYEETRLARDSQVSYAKLLSKEVQAVVANSERIDKM